MVTTRGDILDSDYSEQEKIRTYIQDKKKSHPEVAVVLYIKTIKRQVDHYWNGTIQNDLELVRPKFQFESLISEESESRNTESELGGTTYELRRELSVLYNTIEDSEYLLYLSDNYDSNDSIKPSVDSYHNAILFLTSFANLLFDNKKLYLSAPTISAARDGSIDLSWRSESLDTGMLINFGNDESMNQYYCYRNNRRNEINGFLKEPYSKLNDDNRELYYWMKNNLTKLWT